MPGLFSRGRGWVEIRLSRWRCLCTLPNFNFIHALPLDQVSAKFERDRGQGVSSSRGQSVPVQGVQVGLTPRWRGVTAVTCPPVLGRVAEIYLLIQTGLSAPS